MSGTRPAEEEGDAAGARSGAAVVLIFGEQLQSISEMARDTFSLERDRQSDPFLSSVGKENVGNIQKRVMEMCLHNPLNMVRQEGFEPPAGCLEGSCSIRLSY